MFTILRRLLAKGHVKPSPANRLYFRPRLEVLEERWCPDSTWKGTISALWSNPNNWTNGVPGPADTAIFDHQFSDKTVTVDMYEKVGSVIFQNGFTSIMTIVNPGLEVVNTCDLRNITKTATIFMSNPGASLIIDGTGKFDNFNFTAPTRQGLVDVAATGSLTLTPSTGGTTKADFLIDGELNVANSAGAVIVFQSGASINVHASGTMTIQPVAGVVLSTNNDAGIIRNFGRVFYTGMANITTEVDMALLNHGAADFDTGNLRFGQTSTLTNNYAIKQDMGSIHLSLGFTLAVLNGYYQTGGLLIAEDTTNLNLLGAGAKAEIDGGSVQLGNPIAFGLLKITGDLHFNGGEYDAKVQGGVKGPGLMQADKIAVTGNVTIAGGTLKVSDLGGAVDVGQTWDIITSALAAINGDFGIKDFSGAPHVSGPDPNQLPNGIYGLFYVP